MGAMLSTIVGKGADERRSRGLSTVMMTEEEIEMKDATDAKNGLTADLVMVYPIESEEILWAKAVEGEEPAEDCLGKTNQFFRSTFGKAKIKSKVKEEVAQGLQERQERRSELILKLKQARFVVVLSRSKDEKRMFLKIWAPQERLMQEAERQQIEMLVEESIAEEHNSHVVRHDGIIEASIKKLPMGDAMARYIFGSKEIPRTYKDFDPVDMADFKRKNGRLFNSLERQRLVYAILEGAEEIEGCQQDLDNLVAEKVVEAFVWPHSSEKDELWGKWGAMTIGCLGVGEDMATKVPDGFRFFLWLLLFVFYVLSIFITDERTFDFACGIVLGLLVTLAGACGMFNQPLDGIRDYFGEKTAFYFAWMRHYSQYLIYLSLAAIIAISANASLLPRIDKNNDFDSDEQMQSAYARFFYCLIVAIWTTLYAASWKRENAVLRFVWDVQDFEEEEDPRPEYIASYHQGRWAHIYSKSKQEKSFCISAPMQEVEGFYTVDGRFIPHKGAPKHRHLPGHIRLGVKVFSIPQLLLMTGVMIVGSLSILIFKMITQVSVSFREDPFWGGAFGSQVPTMLSMVWIAVMNQLYVTLAKSLNDLENYRTETEYQNQLILKIVVFTFINSYISLIYIAFIKAGSPEYDWLPNDQDGNPYHDLCGFIPGNPWSDIQDGDFRFANTVQLCSSNVTENCCNFDAEDLQSSGCVFVFVQRDCLRDLRQLMISYTLLRSVYDGLLQILIPLATMLYAQYKLKKEWLSHSSDIRALATGVTQHNRMQEVEIGSAPRSSNSTPSNPPSPPPSPPSSSRASSARSRKESKTLSTEERRDGFHKNIELECKATRYPGTLTEFSTKIIQFGYVAMFSAVFPIAAIASAVANLIEIRLDAIKALTLRRRRYEGAEDIGSWQPVLAFISWVALPANVALCIFTSWSFRAEIIVPAIATASACGPAAPFATVPNPTATNLSFTLTNPALFDFEATLSPRARVLGRLQSDPAAAEASGFFLSQAEASVWANESFIEKCPQNINDCWAPVGGVAWLPALEYLVTSSTPNPASTRFLVDAVCDEASVLYNKLHCNTCQEWGYEIFSWQLGIFILVEHVLILLKLFLAYVIPDEPHWVKDAEARNEFEKTIRKENRRRGASMVGLDDEEKCQDYLKKQAKFDEAKKELQSRLNESAEINFDSDVLMPEMISYFDAKKELQSGFV